MATVVLIHGGLWEDMDASRFWRRPGIVAGLERHGLTVLAPDRLGRPPDWDAEARHLAADLPRPPVTVVAGSNGCSAAVRLALTVPGAVSRMVLAWPATANDPGIDDAVRAGLIEFGAPAVIIDALLAGGTLRGVSDAELGTLRMPVAVIRAEPPSPPHQRRTADALLRLLPQAGELPGCPEPPTRAFPPHLDSFVAAVAAFASGPLSQGWATVGLWLTFPAPICAEPDSIAPTSPAPSSSPAI